MHSLLPVKFSPEGMPAALLFFAAILIPLSFQGVCLGAASHQSYRQTHAHLNLRIFRPGLWRDAG
jgi:hypothetical protein